MKQITFTRNILCQKKRLRDRRKLKKRNKQDKKNLIELLYQYNRLPQNLEKEAKVGIKKVFSEKKIQAK